MSDYSQTKIWSKILILQCNPSFLFSQFISKRKTKRWHWSNTIPPCISARLHSIVTVEITRTLSVRRTGDKGGSCPSQRQCVKIIAPHTSPLGRGLDLFRVLWVPRDTGLCLTSLRDWHLYQWEPSGKTAMGTKSVILLLQAAQTFSLGPSVCVALAVIRLRNWTEYGILCMIRAFVSFVHLFVLCIGDLLLWLMGKNSVLCHKEII